MTWLEREQNEENFGDAETTPLYAQLLNGLYLAFSGFASKTEEYGPKTAAGRVLGILNAFSVFLVLRPDLTECFETLLPRCSLPCRRRAVPVSLRRRRRAASRGSRAVRPPHCLPPALSASPSGPIPSLLTRPVSTQNNPRPLTRHPNHPSRLPAR